MKIKVNGAYMDFSWLHVHMCLGFGPELSGSVHQ